MKMVKIEKKCFHCNGTGIETIEVNQDYRTSMGFKVDEDGNFLMFAMGECETCGKYIPPTFMIYYGDPCPLCKNPFHSSYDISKQTIKDHITENNLLSGDSEENYGNNKSMWGTYEMCQELKRAKREEKF